MFQYLGNVINPSDFHSIIFQRGRAQPPTSHVHLMRHGGHGEELLVLQGDPNRDSGLQLAEPSFQGKDGSDGRAFSLAEKGPFFVAH